MLTVTVRVAPVPVTPVTEAPVMPPPAAGKKSLFDVPVTDSEKVTVNCTLAALVAAPVTRTTEETVGAVLSMV